MRQLLAAAVAVMAWGSVHAASKPLLDLGGYIDPDGAITVQHGGDTVDPYFALQALLLAHEHGLEISHLARPWARWLLPRQKPDATFDRFCRRGPVWGPCKTADADDALLALWVRLLEVVPSGEDSAAWKKSADASRATLARLFDERRRVYLVSPVYQHGLLIDNLEVWATISRRAPRLAGAVQQAFWDRASARYLVSTQPEQAHAPRAFYPDAVAQIFPLLVRFPHVPQPRASYYRAWMREHRGEWLRQVRTDFAWGLVALVAMQEDDAATAGCWLREAGPFRHGVHWTVTDEVAFQVLAGRGLQAAATAEACA